MIPLVELSSAELPAFMAREFGFQVARVHRMGRRLDGWAFDLDYTAGLTGDQVRFAQDAMIKNPFTFALHDPVQPASEQRDRALTLRQLPKPDSGMKTRATVFPALGLGGCDQLRMLVCEGPLLGAWVGGLREDPFTPNERRKLQALLPQLKQWLRLDALRRRAHETEAALDAVLERSGAAALIAEGDEVVFATRAVGSPPPRAEPHQLRAQGWVVTSLGTGARGRERWLAQRCMLPLGAADRLAELKDVQRLTRRQRAVLEAMLLGRSNKEIAELLTCTEATVEAHATQIYRRLSVSSRFELMARFIR